MKLLFLIFFLWVFCILFSGPTVLMVRVPEELRVLLKACRSQLTSDARFGQPGRLSCPLLDPETHVLLDSLVPRFKVSREIPAEYRVYPTGSTGMDWHSDQKVLAGRCYYEAILTVDNDSDSLFQYKNFLGQTVSVSCPPGRLVLVRPNGPTHRVTPVTVGSREIIKFICFSKYFFK